MAKITKKNSELAELRLSWQIAEYSSEADIGEMSTLHEAGDPIIAIRHLARGRILLLSQEGGAV